MKLETLLIIGGTGSLGHCLVKFFGKKYSIVILSRDENKQWNMRQLYPNLTYILADIRDKEVIQEKIYAVQPHKIIIAAAMKHIDICEYNIGECVRTNVIGIQNVVDIIANISNTQILSNLNTVCYISTDKAVSPVNAYGLSKSLGERLVIEKSLTIKKPKFVVVRYGNVLNSRGSVIPFFHKVGQDENKDFFPVTHPDMTRFLLTLEKGVELVEQAMEFGENGDTFIPQVKSYKIIDIAKKFSQRYNKPIKIVGIRPGEKLHECLINQSEKYRTIQKGDVYVLKPCYKNIESKTDFEFEYTSDLNVENNIDELNIDINEI